eukprot:jgi/Mesen1/6770/ME000346S05947
MGIFSCFGAGTDPTSPSVKGTLPSSKDGVAGKRLTRHRLQLAAEDRAYEGGGDQGYSGASTVEVRPAGSSVSSCGSTNIPLQARALKDGGQLAWAHVDELAEEVAELRRRLQIEEEEARRLREEVRERVAERQRRREALSLACVLCCLRPCSCLRACLSAACTRARARHCICEHGTRVREFCSRLLLRTLGRVSEGATVLQHALARVSA